MASTMLLAVLVEVTPDVDDDEDEEEPDVPEDVLNPPLLILCEIGGKATTKVSFSDNSSEPWRKSQKTRAAEQILSTTFGKGPLRFMTVTRWELIAPVSHDKETSVPLKTACKAAVTGTAFKFVVGIMMLPGNSSVLVNRRSCKLVFKSSVTMA